MKGWIWTETGLLKGLDKINNLHRTRNLIKKSNVQKKLSVFKSTGRKLRDEIQP